MCILSYYTLTQFSIKPCIIHVLSGCSVYKEVVTLERRPLCPSAVPHKIVYVVKISYHYTVRVSYLLIIYDTLKKIPHGFQSGKVHSV